MDVGVDASNFVDGGADSVLRVGEFDMAADDVTDENNYPGKFSNVAPQLIERTANVGTGFPLNSNAHLSETNGVYQADGSGENVTGNPTDDFITDEFAVRWQGDITVATDSVYLFTVAADDNISLWLDNGLLLNAWDGADRAVTTYQEVSVMYAGESHALKMEYAENSAGDKDGAYAEAGWTAIAQDTFNLQTFSSSDLSGTPGNGGTVSSIDYSGGANSARWVGMFEFEESDYTFSVVTDGGVRLYVDGTAVIDQWSAPGTTTTHTATVPLEAGLHALKVEYFEDVGTAGISVSWLATSEIAGNALEFDGVDDYVALGNILPNAYTKEAWVKRNSGNQNNNIISSGDGTNKHAFWAPSGQGFKLSSGHNGAWTTVQDSEALAEDTWYHVAVTYDGSSGMKLYKDGELVDSATGVSPLGDDIATNIGKHNTGNWFGGEIDEVRIWNTARSQAQIQAYMKSTLNGDESGLVAYYPFDQSAGSTLTDAAGSYDGTLQGGPQWVTSDALLTDLPAPGSALSFDGSGDYVEVSGASLLITEKSNITLSAWIYPTSNSSGHQGIAGFRNDSDSDFFLLQLQNSTNLQARFRNSDGTYFTLAPDVLILNQWQHVALTYDGSTLRLYHNGVEADSISASGTIENTSESFFISKSKASGYFFNGMVDEVRIWDVTRTQPEIQAYMNRTLDANESGLVAYYNFDEKSGSAMTVLSDIVGSNHGTLNGSPVWTDSGAPLSKMIAPGNAMSFDGTDDYVDLGESAPTLGDTFTQEAWIYPTNSDTAFHGFLGYQSGSRTPSMWVKEKKIHYGFTDDSDTPSWNSAMSGDVLTLNAWNHVAVSFDGSDYTLYVNGTPVHNYTGAAGKTPVSMPVRWIGRMDNYFQGMIDEVRIWDTVRTETEIQDNMYTSVNSAETGLAAYYRFDQSSGTALIDISGNHYDGAVNGNPAWLASGAMAGTNPPGNALSFDGSGDDVTVADHADLEFGANSFSVEAWVKADANSAGDYRNIVGKKLGTGTNAGWLLALNNDLKPILSIADGSDALWVAGSSALATETWVHLAGVVDRSTNTATLYVNGQPVKSGSASAIDSVSSGTVMRLGTWSTSTSASWDNWIGNMDEVRIWNTARSQTEIQASMNSVLSGSESGLAAYYNFNEAGTSLTDVTGAGHDGTLNGDTDWVISGAPLN